MRWLPLLGLVATFGCAGPRPSSLEDGGAVPAPDAGDPAAAPDASEPVPDGGLEDVDAGLDAGADAGPPPAADAPAAPCLDALDSVYQPPAAWPQESDPRGARLACAVEERLDASQVSQRLGRTVDGGVTSYRVSFVTTRSDGRLGSSSAHVWLPQAPLPGPVPLIVWAHGSVGLASSCTPSHDPRGEEGQALPWAAMGYPVIAPDFAGLGTPGLQGYLDNHDTAQSVLDAARALRRLLPAGAADERVVLMGFSQGGGAVLSAQGLERSYGSGGTVVAVVAFAPEWHGRLDSVGMISMLRAPSSLTISHGYTKPAVAAMRQYAYFNNHLPPGHATDAFPQAARQDFQSALDSLCLVPFGGWVQTRLYVADLIDAALRTSLLACVDDPAGAGCVEPGRSFKDFLAADLIAPDPGGAPVLYQQGVLDTVMPIGEEAACNVPLLASAGVDLTLCTDTGASHTTVVDRTFDFGIAWAAARLNGTSPPSCSAVQLPACP